MIGRELHLKEFLNLIASEKQLKNFKITIESDTQSGNGYFGEIIRIKLTGNDTLNLVVKVSVKNDRVRAVVPVDEAYNNESTFYTEIFPGMKELQEKLGIRRIFESVPNFIKAAEYGDQCFLAMEDLTASGFEMLDLKKEVDHDHLVRICQLFGRFHALSFAFKRLRPDIYKNLVGKLQNVHLGFLRYKGGFLKQCASVIKDSFEKKNFSNRMVNHYVENIEETYKRILHDCKNDEYSCIIHYDGWLNNMMFKYQESNGTRTPIDVRLFDWQTCDVGSPAIDISIVLYTIASETILKNLDEYLKIYYHAFNGFLSQTGLKANDIYPFEILKQHWQKYSEYGIMRGLQVQKIRMNIDDKLESFEDAINAEFDVEGMRNLVEKVEEHLQLMKIF